MYKHYNFVKHGMNEPAQVVYYKTTGAYFLRRAIRQLYSASEIVTRGEFNNARARRALVDWYLSLLVMCKARALESACIVELASGYWDSERSTQVWSTKNEDPTSRRQITPIASTISVPTGLSSVADEK